MGADNAKYAQCRQCDDDDAAIAIDVANDDDAMLIIDEYECACE